MIFQHYNLVRPAVGNAERAAWALGYMSALDGMLGNYTEEDKRKAIDLLQEIEMGDRLYNRASDLSGGQKQRVGMPGRLCRNRARFFVTNRPSPLDPNASKIIMDLIYQMTLCAVILPVSSICISWMWPCVMLRASSVWQKEK